MDEFKILNLIRELSVSDIEGANLTHVARELGYSVNDYRESNDFFDLVVKLEKNGLIATVDSDNSRITEAGTRQLR